MLAMLTIYFMMGLINNFGNNESQISHSQGKKLQIFEEKKRIEPWCWVEIGGIRIKCMFLHIHTDKYRNTDVYMHI